MIRKILLQERGDERADEGDLNKEEREAVPAREFRSPLFARGEVLDE